MFVFFFFKQKTAYEMRISDWSSDVCSSDLDVAALGQAYCRTLPAGAHARVIDKTPGNALYLGLVAAALPQARIVHLRRNPMDACYAMYKTLFRDRKSVV